MTDISAGPKFTDRNFISYDGTDSDGVRAEVYVEKNRGKITEIKADEKSGTADVRFQVEGYQHPMHGWMPIDEPAYQEAQRAYAAGEEVAFRIELQRKKSIDRTVPIMEIRERQRDRDRPGIKLLVEVNGIPTKEGLTNPKEDPIGLGGGARRATDEDMHKARGTTPAAGGAGLDSETILTNLARLANEPGSNQAIVDAAIAQAVIYGVALSDALAAVIPANKRDDNQPAVQQYFSNESQAWKLYNPDGRLNLGSFVVASAVGAENLVYQQLASKGALVADNRDDALNYFTNVVLGIADRVQVLVQGEGSRADRGAQSHTRIRGILYTLIEHEYSLPVQVEGNQVVVAGGNAGMKAWMGAVGGATVKRFQAAVQASMGKPSYGLPSSLGGEISGSPSAPAPEQTRVPSAPAPVEEPQVQAQPAPAPVPSAPSAPEPITVSPNADKSARMEAARAILEAPMPTPEEEESYPSDTPGVVSGLIFPPRDVTGHTEQKASKETEQSFKDMLTGNGFDITDRADQVRAGAILRYTFGIAKAAELPDEDLLDFIDHYIATGPEGLHAALEEANKA